MFTVTGDPVTDSDSAARLQEIDRLLSCNMENPLAIKPAYATTHYGYG
jgi:hypothetical protein